ncbi:MAG: hypothetical protein D8G53_14385 [Candidatus Saccharimonas sp.]|jgi:hypothetical protein cdiviTM7_00627|nr:MAG: hypothetical protein D8G53_14385 [Candidatus Saccharimonas sp.]
MRRVIVLAVIFVGFVSMLIAPMVARAAQLHGACDSGAYGKEDCDLIKHNEIDNTHTTISTPIGWAFWLLAAISVIMIVVGGIRYITSQGNQQQLQSAKNTILYAVIGLVVAIAARAIVQLVVDNFYG